MCGPAVRRLACAAPLAAKVRRDAAGRQSLWLVSSGAMLLEGDELLVSVRLRDGATLAVRSVAAQLVHPCPDGGWASLRVEADVGDRCTLDWAPEPTIVAATAGYRADAALQLGGDGAMLRWRDELVLGRTGDDVSSIRLDTATLLDVAGAPCWRDGLAAAPGWRGPAVLGRARYVGTLVVAGAASGDVGPVGDPAAAGWHPLARGGQARRVMATDPTAGRRELLGGLDG